MQATYAEVNNSYLVGFGTGEYNIAEFEISVHDPLLVTVVYHLDQLIKDLEGFVLVELPSSLKIPFKLSTAGIFHDYSYRMQILQREGQFQLNDVGMVEDPQGIGLSVNLVDHVCLHVMSHFDELDCYFFSGHFVIGKVHAAEPPLKL